MLVTGNYLNCVGGQGKKEENNGLVLFDFLLSQNVIYFVSAGVMMKREGGYCFARVALI